MSIPWICQRCLVRLSRPLQTQTRQIRQASTTSSTTLTSPISTALLSRARATAAEHTRLTTTLATTYDTTSAKRLGELTPITTALSSYEKAVDSLSELHSLLTDPTADSELRSLASDDLPSASADLAAAASQLTAALVPKHPFAELPCLLEIRPGVGGGEAALFAGDLLKMYTLLLSRLGLQSSLLKYEAADGMSDALSGSDGPLQEAILEVESAGAYAMLRTEAGVHRVQRVPATESKGRVHTSVANVLVLPSIPANPNDEADSAAVGMGLMVEDPESDYYVSAADVRTDVMRARGAGGQHVNTTDSAVRLTHAPTGTVVAIQDGRSQHKNRAKAWQVLRSRLAQMRREAREEEALKLRRGLSGGGRTMGRADKVRTYNWNQGRVTDHRAGVTVHDLDGVMGGGEALEGIMEAVRGWMRDQEVEGLMAEEAMKEKEEAKEKDGKKK